jgi:hypothetical protein
LSGEFNIFSGSMSLLELKSLMWLSRECSFISY